MKLANPLTAFRWTEPLEINGVRLLGIPEKQGFSFSRAGYLAAKEGRTTDADAWGAAIRKELRPLSAPTLENAREQYAAEVTTAFPTYNILEVTSTCNKKCPFCSISVATRFDEFGNRGDLLLKWADFTKLMKDFGQYEPYGCSLYGYGEPFLWKEYVDGAWLNIADMVKYTKRVGGFRSVNLSTNGAVGNLETILDSDLDDLIISIDGITKNVYEMNRPGISQFDTFERTWKRVHAFLEGKAGDGPRGPFVRVQIINMQNTAVQIVPFLEHFIDTPGVDDCFVKNLDAMAPWLGDSVVSEEEGRIKMELVKDTPCSHLWSILAIASSGQYLACCHDAKSELTAALQDGTFPHIRNTSIVEWWRGPFMTKLRQEHSDRSFRMPCAKCHERDCWL